MRLSVFVALLIGLAPAAGAQTPRPFPTPPRSAPPAPVPERPAPAPVDPAAPDAPTEATLGLPIYPTAQFIASYDAGLGQRFYLFGVQGSFAQLVAYYQTVLEDRGSEVFDEPGTHMFEVGRFRADTMAFPPGVTVKDFTWGGSEGYLNPVPGGTPERFPTILQIVPAPGGDSR
jgi:hypothetical protein